MVQDKILLNVFYIQRVSAKLWDASRKNLAIIVGQLNVMPFLRKLFFNS
jgi:hypothetical protein